MDQVKTNRPLECCRKAKCVVPWPAPEPLDATQSQQPMREGMITADVGLQGCAGGNPGPMSLSSPEIITAAFSQVCPCDCPCDLEGRARIGFRLCVGSIVLEAFESSTTSLTPPPIPHGKVQIEIPFSILLPRLPVYFIWFSLVTRVSVHPVAESTPCRCPHSSGPGPHEPWQQAAIWPPMAKRMC